MAAPSAIHRRVIAIAASGPAPTLGELTGGGLGDTAGDRRLATFMRRCPSPSAILRSFPAAVAVAVAVGVGAILATAGSGISPLTRPAAALVGASVRTDGRAPTPGPDGFLKPTGTTLPAAAVRIQLVPVAQADQPLAVVTRPGDDALYVVEKTGRIKAFRERIPSIVLDVSNSVSIENEQGLLGMAFSPTNPDVLYIDYTDRTGAVNVSELPFDGHVANYQGERVLLHIAKPFNEHNAGTLVFDGAGLLYIAIGDGGGAGDKFNNAQRLDSLLGKVLRIDPHPNGSKPYSIPSTNPFAKSSASVVKKRPEIFLYGLRNPWRISIDPSTGDLWVPDVGQSMFEEVNRIPAAGGGTNLGWRLREGRVPFKGARPRNAVDPTYDYPHADGRCAVVGGAMYRGARLSALVGSYVFGDVCTGQLAVLVPNGGGWEARALGVKVSYLTAFGTGTDGELYATSFEGAVYRLEPVP